MKVLLVAVNAKYVHSNPAVFSLKSYAKKWNDGIEIAEYSINGQTDEMLSDIYLRHPDVVAFSCYIWNMEIIGRLLPEVQKILPNAELWLGGPEVSFHSEQLLTQHEELTGIMVGEGEETFAGLCAFYFDHSVELQEVKGLTLAARYGNTGKPFFTGEREPLALENLPFLYDCVESFENRIVYYESQRGCPFRCSYCLSSIDKSVRFKPMEQVQKELLHLLACRVPQVKFVDRTFNCNHVHSCSIWRFLAEHDNGVTNFHFEIAADLLTEEEMDILSQVRPGLFQLEIGIQSTNPDTIRAVNRVMDFSVVKKRVETLCAYGNMHIHVDLIAGLPYEDLQSFRKSFDDVFALGAEMLQLGFLKVLKGSPMEENATQFGIVYQNTPPYEVLFTDWLSYSDILELKGVEEMTEMYYNSSQYQNTIRYLLKGFSSPYTFFWGLSEYYREHGYEINQPSRMKRYEILREYALDRCEVSSVELLDELLTYDLYLRENVKKRPFFSKNLSAYRELLSAKNGQNIHEEVFHFTVMDETPKPCEPMVLRFDYDCRSALTYNARVEEK